MFRVKICGITNVDDARHAAEAGASAIGLNFFSGSPRVCSLEQATEIARQVPRHVCKVGVFVNAAAHEVRETVTRVGLDMAQLHGDEAPEVLAHLRGLAVVRAFRSQGDLAGVAEYLRECYQRMAMPRLVLLDAAQPGQFGGTGTTLDWESLARGRYQLCGVPLVLAGGLKPENVAQAITVVRPWAVDVASGVETSPGKKSADLVRDFVTTAHAAFATAGHKQ